MVLVSLIKLLPLSVPTPTVGALPHPTRGTMRIFRVVTIIANGGLISNAVEASAATFSLGWCRRH
jgi:hypothetical protein